MGLKQFRVPPPHLMCYFDMCRYNKNDGRWRPTPGSTPYSCCLLSICLEESWWDNCSLYNTVRWVWMGIFTESQLLCIKMFHVLFQRRRSAEDELTMREYLQEGDLISVTHCLLQSFTSSSVLLLSLLMFLLLFSWTFRQKCSLSSPMERCHFTPVV